jgi:hypothetical protein
MAELIVGTQTTDSKAVRAVALGSDSRKGAA